MLKVEIATSVVDVKNGTSAKTGKPYSIREQEGWIFCYDKNGQPYPHPQKIKLTLDDDQQLYTPGNYILCPSSVYVDRFGQVAVRARLRPAVAAAAKAAA